MITQTFKQGDNEIKICVAESIDDAEKNNLPPGVNHKVYVNGKYTDNYMAMIQFIVDESHKNQSKFIPTEKDSVKLRNEMLQSQKKEIIEQLNMLKEKYSTSGVDEKSLNSIDELISQMDEFGVRTG
jgi:hypothetical protein